MYFTVEALLFSLAEERVSASCPFLPSSWNCFFVGIDGENPLAELGGVKFHYGAPRVWRQGGGAIQAYALCGRVGGVFFL